MNEDHMKLKMKTQTLSVIRPILPIMFSFLSKVWVGLRQVQIYCL